MGDININILKQNNIIVNEYLWPFAEIRPISCIDTKIRVTQEFGICIDHLCIYIAENKKEIVEALIVEIVVTDHYVFNNNNIEKCQQIIHNPIEVVIFILDTICWIISSLI